MSELCQSRLDYLNQRACNLGFGSIANLGYWIYLGVDEKTIMRWQNSKKNPKPGLLDMIDGLLCQIEADPHHYMRNFTVKRRPREECCAS